MFNSKRLKAIEERLDNLEVYAGQVALSRIEDKLLVQKMLRDTLKEMNVTLTSLREAKNPIKKRPVGRHKKQK